MIAWFANGVSCVARNVCRHGVHMCGCARGCVATVYALVVIVVVHDVVSCVARNYSGCVVSHIAHVSEWVR